MYERHPTFPPLEPESQIWRYIDLAKLVWTLEHKAIYFPRADRLGDPHEGALPDKNIAARDELVESQPGWQWAEGLEGPEGPARLMVRSSYVSCWNASQVESAALWTSYRQGIAIRSTFERLCRSLRCEEPVYIGSVRYIDYRTDATDPSNSFSPLMHKRKYFEHEREVRAVIPGRQREGEGEDERWATEDPRPGIAVSVDLQTLVQGIHVAPGDSPLLYEAVTSVSGRYELDVPVSRSSLDDPARF